MNPRDNFARAYNVSRETLERLDLYVTLLAKWQQKINLVGASTLPDVWRRHILDSAQLIPMAYAEKPEGEWVDLGSGAGFPGMVIAIMMQYHVHLIESDGRKCAFLTEIARQTRTRVSVHNCRIDEAPAIPADFISARALAPLNKLLGYAEKFLTPNTLCLFLKGQDVGSELTEATKYWNMDTSILPSVSDAAGQVLQIRRLSRA